MACATFPARADTVAPIQRCAKVQLDQTVPEMIGYALKRTKLNAEHYANDRPVIIQPVMAGLKGPRVTLMGRDARLAITTRQSSPQELWHGARWNAERTAPCAPSRRGTWRSRLKRDFHWKAVWDTDIGLTSYDPRVMFRSRAVVETLLMRPYGFSFGLSLSVPLAKNTDALLYVNDPRDPVRRDISRFSNTTALERLYASWRTTPITDVHLSLSAGWLEDMYGGGGGEIVWRPFGRPYWLAADAWHVWRRDPGSAMNANWTDKTVNTGHIRAGYDIPDTRATIIAAVGKYLGGDKGATLSYVQGFEGGWNIETALTWTNRREDAGFFNNTHFNPSVRLNVPFHDSKHRAIRMRVHQVGRDGGQMLDRPMPLEQLTEAFSAREYIRHWPGMLD